jgi:D-sedoheptulose 7-phosphate isomerase
MKQLSQAYYFGIKQLLNSVDVSDDLGAEIGFHDGIVLASELIQEQTAAGKKLIFIGNGASATISSHQATDFWKNGRMKSIAFNDAAGLTCISNDFGYEHVFEKPIEMFAEPGDVLFGISSSGRSANILLGVSAAREKGAKVITLSGFAEDNPLRRLGSINFYVPSFCYGHVEILHFSICHCILDVIVEKKKQAVEGPADWVLSAEAATAGRKPGAQKRPPFEVKPLTKTKVQSAYKAETDKHEPAGSPDN